MEYRDLYDENRTPLFKTIKKGEKPMAGMYYVSVAVAIENDDGTFLLQKRSKDKGGLWATTSGHPKSGETSLEGILTEIKEEIGISVPKEQIKLFKTVKTNDDFVDFYYIKLHILKDKIHLQKEEVSDYMFATKEQIINLIKHKKFYHSHVEMMLDCFEYLENRIPR